MGKKDIISPLPTFKIYLGEEQWLFRMSSAHLGAATNGMADRIGKKHQCYWTWDFANLLLLIRRQAEPWSSQISLSQVGGRRRGSERGERSSSEWLGLRIALVAGETLEIWLRSPEELPTPCSKCTEFLAWELFSFHLHSWMHVPFFHHLLYHLLHLSPSCIVSLSNSGSYFLLPAGCAHLKRWNINYYLNP